MAGSLDGVSEQCNNIAQHFGSPGPGETVYKVTHRDHEGNSFDLENGRHILIKGRSNSHWPRLAGYFVWRIWSASPGKATQALCTDRKGDLLEAAGR